ncbi:hypothetical protein QE152_g1573 [Popillia japonica]|uniref:Uncharacterized protein n=1 Tax=Popillia japonica TaxID=7064 RepID=A0AAW1N768_POPJA
MGRSSSAMLTGQSSSIIRGSLFADSEMSMQSLGSAEESRLAVEESFPLVKMKSTSRTKHHKVTIKQRPKGSRSSRMPLGDSDEMVEEIKPKKAKKKSDSEKETGSEDESKEKKKKKKKGKADSEASEATAETDDVMLQIQKMKAAAAAAAAGPAQPPPSEVSDKPSKEKKGKKFNQSI